MCTRNRAGQVLAGVLTGVLALAGCGGGDDDGNDGRLTGPRVDAGPGSLRVITTTEFPALEPDGFTLRVGTQAPRDVGVADTLELTELAAGTHRLELGDLATGCGVGGPNPREVAVRAGETTTVALQVGCTLRGRLLYSRGQPGSADIYAAEPDGSDPVRLTSAPGNDIRPDVSPDGRRIAFESFRNGPAEIFVANADGTDPVRLSRDGAFDMDPTWSPDGSRIAFTSARSGEPSQIWVMDVDGTNRTRVTDGRGSSRMPAWSPDGLHIAFSSTLAGGPLEIFLASPDGRHLVRLTRGIGLLHMWPAWSPDGSHIVFEVGRIGERPEIWVMDADGGNPSNLTNDPHTDRDPAWSPDGTRIAFSSNRGPNLEIYDMNLDGSDVRQLTEGPPGDLAFGPAFGP